MCQTVYDNYYHDEKSAGNLIMTMHDFADSIVDYRAYVYNKTFCYGENRVRCFIVFVHYKTSRSRVFARQFANQTQTNSALSVTKYVKICDRTIVSGRLSNSVLWASGVRSQHRALLSRYNAV